MSVEDDSGSISPSGRFARMEAALARIEEKLDLKADVTTVIALQADLEAHKQYVTDLVTGKIVSPQTADYMRRWQEMERAVDDLKQAESNRMAVTKASEKSQDARYRALMWVVGITTIVNFMAMLGLSIIIRVQP